MERLGLVGGGELKRALVDGPALWWLVDEKGARWGILAKLGRIRDREEFDAAVRWVLEYRPRTKEAVAEIRRLRTGKSRPPDTGELAEEIIRAVNGYGLRHPWIRREQALEALCSATADVANAARANKAADRRLLAARDLTFWCGTVGEIDVRENGHALSGARPGGDERETSPNGSQDANPPTSVIGVDRVGQAEALREHDASIVVSDLSELVEER